MSTPDMEGSPERYIHGGESRLFIPARVCKISEKINEKKWRCEISPPLEIGGTEFSCFVISPRHKGKSVDDDILSVYVALCEGNKDENNLLLKEVVTLAELYKHPEDVPPDPEETDFERFENLPNWSSIEGD